MQADPGKVRQQLIAEGLELEEVGGDIQVVHTAAPKGEGLLELEEALMLQVLPLPPLAVCTVYAFMPCHTCMMG